MTPENYEGDLDFLRKAHHALLEVLVNQGSTNCFAQIRLHKYTLRTTQDQNLKKHFFVQIEVINGDLVCPETSRKFPVTDGIPNMLLNEDEI